MKKTILATVAALLVTAVAYAQGPPGPPPGGPGHRGEFRGGPGFGPGGPGFGMHEGKVVTGAPYSATFTRQFTETLAGTAGSISRSTTGTVARDSSGRTYEQLTVTGGPLSQGSTTPVQVIFLTDPVAGFRYTIYPAKSLAIQSPFHPHTGTGPTPPATPPANTNPNVTVTKSTTGYSPLPNLVDVTTIVRTIPVQTIGNSAPLTSTTVIEYSPDLQTVVSTSRNDPRTGQESYALTITSLTADPTLFTVPSGYTIQQHEQGRRGPGGPRE